MSAVAGCRPSEWGPEGASVAARGSGRWMALHYGLPAAALKRPPQGCKWPRVCYREAQVLQSRIAVDVVTCSRGLEQEH